MADVTNPADRREERVDADTLRVTRRSTFTGAVHTLDLPITADDWETYLSGRELIQDALPRLTNPQREFLMTGSTQAEWEAAFAPDPDEEDLFGEDEDNGSSDAGRHGDGWLDDGSWQP